MKAEATPTSPANKLRAPRRLNLGAVDPLERSQRHIATERKPRHPRPNRLRTVLASELLLAGHDEDARSEIVVARCPPGVLSACHFVRALWFPWVEADPVQATVDPQGLDAGCNEIRGSPPATAVVDGRARREDEAQHGERTQERAR